MFVKRELETLRLQKDILVLQSEAQRLALTTELQRLRSADFWRGQARQAASQHPMLTAGLGLGAGIFAIKALRQPGAVMSWLGRLGGIGSVFRSVWKMLGRT